MTTTPYLVTNTPGPAPESPSSNLPEVGTAVVVTPQSSLPVTGGAITGLLLVAVVCIAGWAAIRRGLRWGR